MLHGDILAISSLTIVNVHSKYRLHKWLEHTSKIILNCNDGIEKIDDCILNQRPKENSGRRLEQRKKALNIQWS